MTEAIQISSLGKRIVVISTVVGLEAGSKLIKISWTTKPTS